MGLEQLLTLFVFVCMTWVTSGNIINKTALNGFPLGVTCGSAKTDESLPDTDTCQCIINTEDQVLFNETISCDQKEDEGSLDASETFHDKTINVTLTRGNFSISNGFRMQILEPDGFNGSYTPKGPLRTHKEGEDFLLPCSDDKESLANFLKADKLDMTKDQYRAFNTTWYHDSEPLIRGSGSYYKYYPVRKGHQETLFDAIELPNASLVLTPGNYHCVVEYKGRTLRVESHKVCVTEPEKRSIRLSIKPDKELYTPEPGKTVVVKCGGKAGRSYWIAWKKLGEKDSHEISCHRDSDMKDCKFDYSLIKVCKRQTKGANIMGGNTEKNFAASYTIRNINESHSGKYQCTVSGSAGQQSANFTILVTSHEPRRIAQRLLVVLGSLLVVAMALLIIYRIWKIEIKYCCVKLFKKEKESDKLTTCLIYADDALSKDQNEYSLRDVTDWLNSSKRRYYDPNDGKELHDAGTIAGHTHEVLDNCLSMTVILTPNLLLDDTVDIFKTYRGFQDNVERNLSVVFICSKEMEKEIKRSARSKDCEAAIKSSCITFRKFMKMNKVVRWEPGGSSRFNKAMFVAMPRVWNPIYSSGRKAIEVQNQNGV